MKNNVQTLEQPFDELAGNYDVEFTNTDIGRMLRGRTHQHLELIFPAGSHILEINCGTGEDAAFLAGRGVRVTATDASAEMVKVSRAKIKRLGLSDRVTAEQCRIEDLNSVLEPGQVFDGVVSNFGGLNCVDDIQVIAHSLAGRVRSGGHCFLCVMGRWTPWEWLLLGCRGELSRICRRASGKSFWRGKSIRYFTPGQLLRVFGPHFVMSKVCGLGFLLPPTYAGSLVSRYPRLFSRINVIEERCESVFGIPQLSDHFMLVLSRK